MPLWQWLLDALGVLLVVVGVSGGPVITRGGFIARPGGTCAPRSRPRAVRTGRGWVLGIGRYTGDQLEWFRIFSLAPRPTRVWARPELAYVGRRDPVGPEQMSLFAGHLVVTCSTPDGMVELAMSPASLTGFQAWLEASPPGVGRVL